MEPKISVFLLSYNKGAYVLDAMRSVFGQSRTDWELFILENSNDGQTHEIVKAEIAAHPELWPQITYERLEGPEIESKREQTYLPAWLLNCYYPEAQGEYIFYISDDDYIDPDCFKYMAGELDEHNEYGVVYAGIRFVATEGPGKFPAMPMNSIPALDPKTYPGSVDGRVDGGQIMHRKLCLDVLVPPFFDESPAKSIAQHADGIFLERLVGRFPFWPVDRYLITHRRTEHSLWGRMTHYDVS